MSKKYGIFCENCNVLLNNEDNIFGTNFGQLFHSTCMGGINQGKSADGQNLTLFKMNLKFADTPTLTTEAEREIMELKNSNNAAVQKLKAKIKTLEDALLVKDRLKDDVNKLMDCVVKLANTLSINVDDKAADIVNNTSQDKSNKEVYDKNNLNGDESSLTEEEEYIEQNNSNNGVLESVQQLEAKIKTLKDALLQTNPDGNNLTDFVETDEKNKAVDNTPGDGNNITQDSNANKETPDENNLSAEQHNDTDNIASATEENDTCTISQEKPELLDLRRNCVYIQNFKCSDTSLDMAFSNIRNLATEMKARIADHSVIHIDVDAKEKNYLDYYVYFRDEDSKKEFLKNRFIYKYDPDYESRLRILDYSNCGILDIEVCNPTDLGLDTAFVYVLGLAKKNGIYDIISFIDHIDVYRQKRPYNCFTYSVRFNREDVRNRFLEKGFSPSNGGGHTSTRHDVNNFSMSAASANVIGVAELLGLSLSTDNFKRIYVLNAKQFYPSGQQCVSLVVEFFSNDIKNKFLKKKSELNEIENTWSSDINISDIEAEGRNIISIKYNTNWMHNCTAVSFIGLAKQLGFSFTPDQTDLFFKLSDFILKADS